MADCRSNARATVRPGRRFEVGLAAGRPRQVCADRRRSLQPSDLVSRDSVVSALVIDRPGMLTTVQDLGRRGFQALGVPVSGAMDPWSARLANRLVGDPDRFAVLEITLVGPRFTAERDARIAVAGGDFEVRIANEVSRVPFVSRVQKGVEVAFGGRARGARAYLAIDGGIATGAFLGSASTHLLARMGGFGGRALKAGERGSR